MKDTRLFKRLFAYMKPYLLRYVVAIVFMIIIVGIDVITPLLISASLAELGKEVIDFNKIVMYFIVCLGLALVSSLIMEVIKFIKIK